jgi:hypothetical protein
MRTSCLFGGLYWQGSFITFPLAEYYVFGDKNIIVVQPSLTEGGSIISYYMQSLFCLLLSLFAGTQSQQ